MEFKIFLLIIKMSEYVSMKSIKLKNDILTPKVLAAYRSGNLTFDEINDVQEPLKEIYANTYQYLDFPVPSDAANALIKNANNTNNAQQEKLKQARLVYFPANDNRNMS